MTQTEALKLALDALESDYVFEWPAMQRPERVKKKRFEAIAAIKEALANHIEDNLVMVTRGDAWRKQLTSAQRNELKQIEDGTWEADRNG